MVLGSSLPDCGMSKVLAAVVDTTTRTSGSDRGTLSDCTSGDVLGVTMSVTKATNVWNCGSHFQAKGCQDGSET